MKDHLQFSAHSGSPKEREQVLYALEATLDSYAMMLAQAIVVVKAQTATTMPTDNDINGYFDLAEQEVVRICKMFAIGGVFDISGLIKKELFLAVHRRCIEIVEKGI